MIWLFILEEILLFVVMISFINKHDKENVINVSLREFMTIGILFTVMQVVLFSFYGYGRELICHSLGLYYLMFAAFIDHKIKRVYRIGSIFFIVLSIILFFFAKDIDLFAKTERFISVLIFSILVIIQGTLGWMGWGDVLTYIGTFFFLGSWRYKCMSLELLAVYMLLANVIFLIINIKNFDWKVKRMKSEAAFLPGMACAAFFLELIRGLN